jgi:hypothetical protein
VLEDLAGGDAPFREVRADSQRHVEGNAAGGERADGVHVEVIVVIVRDDHGADL